MPTSRAEHRLPIEDTAQIKTFPIAARVPRERKRNGRLADLLIAWLLIAFTLPLMMIVALAIKCESSGPVFNRQERIGRGGRRFMLLAFRTTVHRPEYASYRLHRSETTRVGRFLRYTRIDTLPQLMNVLRGEMTVIGTGAERFEFLDAA
jgi:lipopolysaccharide/colanic/teichoic acid biosynthesis glycosyltransferase